MAEQVKVFKNVVDQVLPVTATDVVLHTTSSTQRAVLRDLDCINLGSDATLDLDGRTMNSGTDAGVLERTKSSSYCNSLLLTSRELAWEF